MNFFDIGPLELIVLFVVILLVFGPDKLGEVARGIGKGVRKFREASLELTRSIQKELNESEQKQKQITSNNPDKPPAAAGSSPPNPDKSVGNSS